MLATSTEFPVPVRIDFTPEAWRRVGHFAKDDFENLQRFLGDLADRLTLAALSPEKSTRLRWSFACEPGPSGVCELDLPNRRLTVVTVAPAEP